jgi:hypothetical protein
MLLSYEGGTMAVKVSTIRARLPDWRRASLTSLLAAGTYILALVALIVLAQHATAWGQARLDDLRYGMPRTVHLAGVVGGDSAGAPTRFVGLNLDGQISIMVMPAGDSSKLAALPGPYVIGRGGAEAVPHLELADLTGDGQADLLLTVRGETVVYVNHEGTFALITPEERARLQAPGGP